MIEYPTAAWERAMKAQEVILRAMSGELSWLQAADILGYTARHLRRLREHYQVVGLDGLLDKRRGRPSPKRAGYEEVQGVLRLYRETYLGFNVRHFHEIAQREHGMKWSYNFVRKALQAAGLVTKRRARGRHHKRREPRACFGEMLHIDGSPHEWLALCPGHLQVLITVLDDATKDILYAQLWPGETTEAILSALHTVVTQYGIPMALYSDRASWAFYTPQAGGKVDKERLTQVGRALKRLGVEHIPAYTPQARGRSERLNRTLQDRLVNELRAAGIRAVSRANQYIQDVFIPRYRQLFRRAARDTQSLFVQVIGTDLEQILCVEEERKVGNDNTVVLDGVRLQITKQPGRATCAGLAVTVRRHLSGRHTIWRGQQLYGWYDRKGRPEQKVA